MNTETRQAIHRLLDACIDKSEAGGCVWFEFVPHIRAVKWKTFEPYDSTLLLYEREKFVDWLEESIGQISKL